MPSIRLWLIRLCCFWAVWLSVIAGVHAKTLLWITADITPEARTALLKQAAEAHGWTFRHTDVPLSLSATERPVMRQRISAQMRQSDLILVDAPHASALRVLQAVVPQSARRSNDGDGPKVRQRQIGPVWITDGAPTARANTAEAWLADYLRNGGALNTRHAIALADQLMTPGAGAIHWQGLPPPKVFPVRGVYHAQAADFFPDAAALHAWVQQQPNLRGRPSVAILVHRHHFINGDTAWLDAWLDRFADKGMNAYAVFGQRLDAGSLRAMVGDAGRGQTTPLPEVVVVSQLVSQSADLQALFKAWQTPVLSAVPYRHGDRQAWEADTTGIRQSDTPFYLVQPEAVGAIDPLVVVAQPPEGKPWQLIGRQADALVGKAQSLIALRQKPMADKQISLMVYNYPAGGSNFGASFLNVPRSLQQVSGGLAQAGVQTQAQPEAWWISQLQPLLQAYYGTTGLQQLLENDQAAALPLRDYQVWFDTLPAEVQARIMQHWGSPETSQYIVSHQGQRVFVIPRLQIGNLRVLPQPPRSEMARVGAGDKAFAHKTDVPLSHHYLAVYLWARQADALIHFGTHGTQEWADGKSRGLDVNDDALLPLGNTPVIYPYIVDNLGEALTAKRRGRATLISHRTPVMGTAGFSPEMARLHELMHEWSIADQGPTKQGIGDELARLVVQLNLHKDLNWSVTRLRIHMDAYLEELHPWLDQLAQSSQPRGLAVFGVPPDQTARELLILQTLRLPLLEALGEDIDEAFLIDYRTLDGSRPMQWLRVALQDSTAASTLDLRQRAPDSVIPNKAALQPINPTALFALAERAQRLNQLLAEEGEMPGLLNALNGGFVPAAYGGDPIRNPDSLPTGRNLIGLDPLRLPTQQAYSVAQGLFDDWLKDWRQRHQGAWPERLVLSLWAGETLRHHGVMEAQAMMALGVRPIWDESGRPRELQLIPPAELGRPRIDVLLSITGSYRDQFPALMALLDKAVAQVVADEPEGMIARSSRTIARELQAQGVGREQAQRLSRVRVFGNAIGDYGTGVADAVLSDHLRQRDDRLGQLFLQRMGQPYIDGAPVMGVDRATGAKALGAHLRRSDAAILSRTSNLYGMVSSDDPFQYLGGLSAAARAAGRAQGLELYVSQLQTTEEAHTTSAQRSIALEMQSRYLHPGWVAGQQQESYAGTLQVLKAAQFAWGWQTVQPDSVRPDHWQSFYDVFVKDRHQLGTPAWLRTHPEAYAQTIERLIQAERHGYWQPDQATRQSLATLYNELTAKAPLSMPSAQARAWAAKEAGVSVQIASDVNVAVIERVAMLAQGQQAAPVRTSQPQPTQPSPASTTAPSEGYVAIKGARLSKVDEPDPVQPSNSLSPWLAVLLLLCPVLAGGWVQYRAGRRA